MDEAEWGYSVNWPLLITLPTLKRRMVVYEAVGIVAVIVLRWADEVFDLPHLLLGASPTPVNWQEAALESAFVALIGIFIIALTSRFLAEVRYLEGFLVLCAFCKKVKVSEERWIPLEEFVTEHAEVRFSHSYCPKCLAEHYGDSMGIEALGRTKN